MRPIVVKRSSSLGDVLLAEPLLRQLVGQGGQVYLLTDRKYGNLLAAMPGLSGVLFCETAIPYRSRIIDLDNSYEQRLDEYITLSYFKKAEIEVKVDLQPQLHVTEVSGFEDHRYIVLDVGYPGCRQQFMANDWQIVINKIAERGFETVLVGDQWFGDFKNAIDLRRGFTKQSLTNLVAVIRDCSYFIGIDSGPLHIARAYDKSGIGLYCAYADVSLREFANNRIVSHNCDCRQGEQELHLKCLKQLPMDFILEEVSLLN